MRTRAEEFGGEFEVISRPGAGTTIEFSIPYAIAHPEEHRSRLKILVVLFALQIAFAVAYIFMISVSMVVIISIGMVRQVLAYRRTSALS